MKTANKTDIPEWNKTDPRFPISTLLFATLLYAFNQQNKEVKESYNLLKMGILVAHIFSVQHAA